MVAAVAKAAAGLTGSGAGNRVRTRDRRVARKSIIPLSAAVLAGLISSGLAHAQQTLWWDASLTPATPSGGAGTWDTATTSNWSNLATDVQWTDNFSGTDTAVFGGTAGTVNISAGTTSTANVIVFNTSGYNITGGQDLNLQGTNAAIVTNANATISTVLFGSNAVTTSGSGTLTLTGANYLTGGLTISSGSVAANNNQALGDATTNVVLGDANTGNQNITLSSNAGELMGSSLTVANQGTGTVTLSLTAQNAAFYDQSIVLNRPTTFAANYNGVGGAYFGIYSNTGVISGNVGTITVEALGTGGAYVPGNNTFVGTVQLPQGTVTTFANGAFGGGVNAVVMSGTSNLGLYNSNLTIGDLTGASGNIVTTSRGGSNTLTIMSLNGATFAGTITGTGGLTIAGTATQTLTGANTYTGVTNISGGTLALGDGTSGHDGSIAGASIVNNANLTYNLFGASTYAGPISGSGNLTMSGAGALTLSGPISGNGNVTMSGTGMLTLSGSNTYSGTTIVNGGTLTFPTPASFYSGTPANWTSTNLTVASGATAAFGVGSGQFTAANIATLAALGTGSGGFLSGSSIGLDTTGGSFVYASPITNPNGGANLLGVTKIGLNSLTLSAANTYTGPTNVLAGSLVLNAISPATGSLSASAVNVSGGAAFLVQGSTSVASLALAGTPSASSLNLQDGRINTLTVGGNLSLGTGSGGSAISVDLGAASGLNDKITVTGSLTANGTTAINIDALAFLASGTTNYTLLTDASGTSMAGGAGFTIGTAPVGTNTYSLANSTANSLILTVNVVASTTAYWTGKASANTSGGSTDSANNSWGYGSVLSPSQTNWSSAANGLTDPLQEPSPTTDVIFTAANATSVAGALSTQLDSNFSIKGLSFDTSGATTAISSVGINSNGKTLTVGADGLVISPSDNSSTTISGTGTILTGFSQSWTNNSASQNFTVSAGIAGTATTGTQTLTLAGNSTGLTTLSGPISNGTGGGNLGLAFSQSGTAVLSGSNSFTGPVAVNTGILNLQSSGALGASSGATVTSGATLQLQGGITVASTPLSIGGTGVSNQGALTNLSGTNAYNGPITLSSSASIGVTAGSLGLSNINVSSFTLTAGGSSGTTGTVAGVISGTGKLAVAGSGTLVLTGANTFTGGTTITSGTLQLGDGTTGHDGSLVAGGGIADAGTLVFNVKTGQTYAGIISGAGAVTKTGPGALNLSGASTFTGGMTISSGTVISSNQNGLGATAGNTVFGDANTGTSNILLMSNSGYLYQNSYTVANQGTGTVTIDLTAQNAGFTAPLITLNRPTTFETNFTTGGAYFGPYQGTGVITGSVGTLTLAGLSTGGVYLTGTNTFVGMVDITQGKVYAFSNNLAFGGSGNSVVMSGSSTLEQYGSNLAIGDLTGTSGNTIVTNANGTYTLTINSSNSAIFAGAITGTGALAKAGTGTQTFAGANTYTGVTTINGGTLALGDGTTGHDGSIAGASIVNNANLTYNTFATQSYAGVISGSGTVTKTGNGTLTLSGSNSYSGATNLSSGTLNVVGALSGTSGVTLASGATLTGSGNNSTTAMIGAVVSNNVGGGKISLPTAVNSTSLTINGLSLGSSGTYGAGNYTTLSYALGTGVEVLNIGTAGTPTGGLNVNSGGAYISFVGSPISGTYTLANFGSATGIANVSLSNTSAGVTSLVSGFSTLNLIENPTSLQLGVVTTAIPVAYFKGGVSTVWNDASQAAALQSNWSSDSAGAIDAGNTPGPLTDVFLNASNQSGTVTTTLGASITIDSLTVTGSGTNSVAADGSTLTINGDGSANGITIASGANAFTINTPLVLGNSGANQTWTNNSPSLFTAGGTVTGTAATGNTQTLTLVNTNTGGTTIGGAITDVVGGGKVALVINNSGTGFTTLTGANTFTGGTTITAGTLQIGDGTSGHDGSLATVGGITNNGALIFNSNTAESYGGAISGSGTITTTGPGAVTLSGVISGSNSINATGLGLVTISGINTYTGNISVSGGTLLLASPTSSTNTYTGGTVSINGASTLKVTSPGSRYDFLGKTFIFDSVGGGNINVSGTSNFVFALAASVTTNINTSGGARDTIFGGLNMGGSATDTTFFNLSRGSDATADLAVTGVMSNGAGIVKTGTGILLLSGADTYTGGTNISGGKVIFAAPAALPVFSALTVGATAIAAANPVGSGITGAAKNNLFASGLNLSGGTNAWTGKVDLANNDLDVRAGNLGQITNQVAQGYNNGTWNNVSGGIVSSTAAASTTHLTALGVIQNSTNQAGGTKLYASFDGQTSAVANTDVLVKYTYYGDANLSGSVDSADYTLIDNGYLTHSTGWYNGDFNYDSVVNGSDYTLIDNAFNTQGASLAAEIATPTAQIAGASAVPEPTTLGLLGLGAVGLLGRRNRRRAH